MLVNHSILWELRFITTCLSRLSGTSGGYVSGIDILHTNYLLPMHTNYSLTSCILISVNVLHTNYFPRQMYQITYLPIELRKIENNPDFEIKVTEYFNEL